MGDDRQERLDRLTSRLAECGWRIDRATADAARAREGFTGPIPGAGTALHMARRHRDFAGIRTRLKLGIPLTPEERATLDALDRGDKLKRGPKDPATSAAETVVCWRWLVDRAGWKPADARGAVGDMMGVSADTIRARLAGATGLARNIADHAFDVHAQRDVTPALLRHRTPAGHCMTCRRIKCRCDPSPRPAFEDTQEGGIVAALLSFGQLFG